MIPQQPQQSFEHNGPHCLLCLNPVPQQGDVCSSCEPRYLALGKALIAYGDQLGPMLDASPRKHVGAPMRFVPDIHFFLQALDKPVLYEGQKITHQLTVLSIRSDGSLQRDSWYGHNIPSTFMAATINRGFTKMGFPEEPDYFVPISSWKAVAYAKPNDEATRRGRNDPC